MRVFATLATSTPPTHARAAPSFPTCASKPATPTPHVPQSRQARLCLPVRVGSIEAARARSASPLRQCALKIDDIRDPHALLVLPTLSIPCSDFCPLLTTRGARAQDAAGVVGGGGGTAAPLLASVASSEPRHIADTATIHFSANAPLRIARTLRAGVQDAAGVVGGSDGTAAPLLASVASSEPRHII
ncbi:hypothetical protein C8R44DRAFT_882817 [Mycena epipterygia]|nr:hypothetical protein C8R44DRAFT_882817 [Mycena epipterygia]